MFHIKSHMSSSPFGLDLLSPFPGARPRRMQTVQAPLQLEVDSQIGIASDSNADHCPIRNV